MQTILIVSSVFFAAFFVEGILHESYWRELSGFFGLVFILVFTIYFYFEKDWFNFEKEFFVFKNKLSISLICKFQDFWIGVFWDDNKGKVYVLPLPCLGFCFSFKDKKD